MVTDAVKCTTFLFGNEGSIQTVRTLATDETLPSPVCSNREASAMSWTFFAENVHIQHYTTMPLCRSIHPVQCSASYATLCSKNEIKLETATSLLKLTAQVVCTLATACDPEASSHSPVHRSFADRLQANGVRVSVPA